MEHMFSYAETACRFHVDYAENGLGRSYNILIESHTMYYTKHPQLVCCEDGESKVQVWVKKRMDM